MQSFLFVLLFGVMTAYNVLAEDVCLAADVIQLAGDWEQYSGESVIAVKRITVGSYGANVEYVDLAPNYEGGEYSSLTFNRDKSIIVYEDYGDLISKHMWRQTDADTIQGSQYAVGEDRLVTDYIMKRKK